jgi:hypothetical protein
MMRAGEDLLGDCVAMGRRVRPAQQRRLQRDDGVPNCRILFGRTERPRRTESTSTNAGVSPPASTSSPSTVSASGGSRVSVLMP